MLWDIATCWEERFVRAAVEFMAGRALSSGCGVAVVLIDLCSSAPRSKRTVHSVVQIQLNQPTQNPLKGIP